MEEKDERREEEERNEMGNVKTKRDPEKPSEEEIEKHMASGHAVYRSWCEFCVRGQSKSDPHKRSGEGEQEITVVSIGYA